MVIILLIVFLLSATLSVINSRMLTWQNINKLYELETNIIHRSKKKYQKLLLKFFLKIYFKI